MASELKSFTITGEAAKEYAGFSTKKKGGKRATAKKLQEGGEPIIRLDATTTLSPPQRPVAALSPPVANHSVNHSANPVTNTVANHSSNHSMMNKPTDIQQQQQQQQQQPQQQPQQQQQQAGTRQIKVELKKKTTAKKVHLQPKKTEVVTTKKHPTRKIRKVSIGLSSFHKRITRAKKVHTTIKAMPIDKLREQLIQKKLIKATSKAPEAILRQIAADSQIVAGKSL